MRFPKVLILGQTFNSRTGGGITLTNLFREWPKENIAAISSNINEEWRLCSKQYLIGFRETKTIWPIYLFQDNKDSAIIYGSEGNQYIPRLNELSKINKSFYSKSKNIIKSFLNYLGLFHFFKIIKITSELNDFITKFSPDIIYTQLASLSLIRLVLKIQLKYNVPFVIHIMDDWPTTIYRKGLFGYFLNKFTHYSFRRLIKKSAACLSISQKMSDEYSKRYGNKWSVFHNPIDIEKWIKVDQMKNISKNFIYTGRIGIANFNSLLFFSTAIYRLKNEIPDINFTIYSPDFQNKLFLSCIKKFDNVLMHEPISYNKIPSVLSKAKALVLPLDFDEKALKFARFSMPTKATEYMASGIPIIIFAPSKSAVAQYAINCRWGLVVDKQDMVLLKKSIIDILMNDHLRKTLIERSLYMSQKNHNAQKIRMEFKTLLISCLNERD